MPHVVVWLPVQMGKLSSASLESLLSKCWCPLFDCACSAWSAAQLWSIEIVQTICASQPPVTQPYCHPYHPSWQPRLQPHRPRFTLRPLASWFRHRIPDTASSGPVSRHPISWSSKSCENSWPTVFWHHVQQILLPQHAMKPHIELKDSWQPHTSACRPLLLPAVTYATPSHASCTQSLAASQVESTFHYCQEGARGCECVLAMRDALQEGDIS